MSRPGVAPEPVGQLQGRRKAKRRPPVMVGAFLLLAWVMVAGITLARTGLELRSGKSATDRARATSRLSDIAEGRPIPELHRARREFSRANGHALSPVLAPMRLFPVLGRQLRSVVASTRTPDQLKAVSYVKANMESAVPPTSWPCAALTGA